MYNKVNFRHKISPDRKKKEISKDKNGRKTNVTRKMVLIKTRNKKGRGGRNKTLRITNLQKLFIAEVKKIKAC